MEYKFAANGKKKVQYDGLGIKQTVEIWKFLSIVDAYSNGDNWTKFGEV